MHFSHPILSSRSFLHAKWVAQTHQDKNKHTNFLEILLLEVLGLFEGWKKSTSTATLRHLREDEGRGRRGPAGAAVLVESDASGAGTRVAIGQRRQEAQVGAAAVARLAQRRL